MELNEIVQELKVYNKVDEYTGFTTKCRHCNTEVKCTYTGHNENNVPCYEITCQCDNNSRSTKR